MVFQKKLIDVERKNDIVTLQRDQLETDDYILTNSKNLIFLYNSRVMPYIKMNIHRPANPGYPEIEYRCNNYQKTKRLVDTPIEY